MKKIVDGKIYDTETATEIGSAESSGVTPSDFGYWRETLYKTRAGVYFLVGEGGALTSYARPVPGGGWMGGLRLTPLPLPEAFQWAQAHLTPTTVELEFPELVTEA